MKCQDAEASQASSRQELTAAGQAAEQGTGSKHVGGQGQAAERCPEGFAGQKNGQD